MGFLLKCGPMWYLGKIRTTIFNLAFDHCDWRMGVQREDRYWEMSELQQPWRISLPMVSLIVTRRIDPQRERDEQ